MTSRTFTRQQLNDLGLPYELIEEDRAAQYPAMTVELHREQTDRRRWASTHKLIFRAPDDGMAYRITYQSPLTEHQECDPWFDADEVKATEVEQRPVVAQQWLPVDAPRDPGLDTVLPAWEAMYEPGNVSDYLIGYANSEAAAKGAAEAWLRSQKDEPGRLEWVPQTPLDGYDTEAELIERHDDGIDTGPGITVRRRTPAAR